MIKFFKNWLRKLQVKKALGELEWLLEARAFDFSNKDARYPSWKDMTSDELSDFIHDLEAEINEL